MSISSSTEATRDLITRMYAAAAGGGLSTLQKILDPDLIVTEPDFLPYGGVHEGMGAFAALFGQVGQVIDLSRLVLDGLTVENEMAYARVRVPLVQGGGEAAIVEEWQVRDGRVARARVLWLNSQGTT